MLELVGSLGNWTWFIVAVLFLGLEIAAPGAFLIWLGIGAFFVGVLGLVVDLSWQGQGLIFIIVSVLSALAGRRFYAQSDVQTDDPFLNERGARYVGMTFRLDEEIRNNSGRVRIDDSFWRVSGPDCDAGTDVVVIAAHGPMLEVEPKQ